MTTILVIVVAAMAVGVIVHLWSELTDLRREFRKLNSRVSQLGGQVQGLRRVRVGLPAQPEPVADPFDKFWHPV